MVIELAWRFFFVNYLTDGEDKQRKAGRQEIGELRSVGVIAGNGLRVAGDGLRGASYGFRGASCGQLRLRVKGMAHRARCLSMEGAGRSKGVRVTGYSMLDPGYSMQNDGAY